MRSLVAPAVGAGTRHGDDMGELFQLAQYRRKARQAFLAKYAARIDHMIESFVRLHVDVDFRQLADDFQSGRYGQDQASWDYVEFREVLAEALDEVFGKAMYEMLKRQYWFDCNVISKDEIVDRCLSTYVLAGCSHGGLR